MQTDQSRVGPRPDQSKPPPWRDVRVLRIVLQAVFLALVLALLWYLWGNLRTNLRNAGLPTGFGFLDQPARVDIRDTDFRPSQPIRDALMVGFLNTIRVSVLGIALATVLGVMVGVARLSTNWLVRKSAALYVETLRNVPVLLIIIFMYLAVVLKLPQIREAPAISGLVVSNRGVFAPWLVPGQAFTGFLAVLAGALVLAVIAGLWRTRRSDATGQPHHRIAWGAGIVVVLGAVGFVALGEPASFSLPLRDGHIVEGGMKAGPEYAALLLALVIYTASHIAEIVRGSILAVPKGQTEAANAIALTGFQRLRFVVLPQSFRIAVPPMANQYLNLTKNSSLAVAIGYFDLTRITGQSIANANPAPQSIAILMLAYLVLSLTISAIANVVNRSLALEAR